MKKHSTELTCDRCGLQIEKKDQSRAYMIFSTKKMVIKYEDLCGDCEEKIKIFLDENNKKAVGDV